MCTIETVSSASIGRNHFIIGILPEVKHLPAAWYPASRNLFLLLAYPPPPNVAGQHMSSPGLNAASDCASLGSYNFFS